MKHALLARVLVHLAGKDAPFRYIETHAGIGLYDLGSEEAARTGEWRGGIGLLEAPFAPEIEALLAPYRAAVAAVRPDPDSAAYPGSPLVAASLLRRQDRAILIEKHPDDVGLLAEAMRGHRRMKVMAEDGWLALPGLVPPQERRGVVLADPPYERTDELRHAKTRLAAALRRWQTGIFMLWYPVKDPTKIASILAEIAEISDRPCLRLELYVEDPARDPARLNGSGLLVVNPPWRLAEEARLLLSALAPRLGRGGAGSHLVEALGRPA